MFVLIISSFLIETSQASDSDVVAEKKVVCGGFYEGVKTHGPDKSDKVRPYLSDDSNEDSVTYWLKDGVLKDLNKLREHQGKKPIDKKKLVEYCVTGTVIDEEYGRYLDKPTKITKVDSENDLDCK